MSGARGEAEPVTRLGTATPFGAGHAPASVDPSGQQGRHHVIDHSESSLLVPRNAKVRSGRWIDSPRYVGLELRFVQRP